MKKLIVTTISAAGLLLAPAVQAEDTKIGIVDLDQAVMATENGKAAREELERIDR